MGRLDNPDFKTSEEEGDKASDSMFINARLKNDLNTIHVIFLETITYGTSVFKGQPSKKGQVNVASYDKGTGVFEDIFLLEMAPKHMKRFNMKLAKPQCGLKKLYEIERHGLPNDTDTYYELEVLRDLTPDEVAFLEDVPLHERFAKRDTNGDSPSPQSPPPAHAPTPEASSQGDHAPEATDHKLFVEALKVEMKKRGWGSPDYEMANKKFFGSHYQKFEDLNPVERQDILQAIRVLPNDAQAKDIVYRGELGDDLDLESDVDFF